MNVIVSGASSGIGRAVVERFLELDHQVLAIARRESRLKAISTSDQYTYMSADLCEEGLESRIKSALSQWERVDILINNAGALINRPFMESSLSDFKQMYNSNVISAVNLIQSVESYLRAGSHIVNISSMGGVQGSSKYPGLSAYSSAKGGLSILTECIAEEFKEKQVSVNALALGAVQTEMLAEAFPGFDAGLSAEEMAGFIVDFALRSGKLMSGKVVEVARGNP